MSLVLATEYGGSGLQPPCKVSCKAAATSACHAVDMRNGPVDELIAAIEHAGMKGADVFCEDAVLDATVPNWRFTVRGGADVQAQLAGWFASPGRFEELRRTTLPDGELVEFVLTWEERGIPHACHQAHVLKVVNGRIAGDVAFCGGRWPASLLAEMEAASQSAEREQARAPG
jgi:hypothetical protein